MTSKTDDTIILKSIAELHVNLDHAMSEIEIRLQRIFEAIERFADLMQIIADREY